MPDYNEISLISQQKNILIVFIIAYHIDSYIKLIVLNTQVRISVKNNKFKDEPQNGRQSYTVKFAYIYLESNIMSVKIR